MIACVALQVLTTEVPLKKCKPELFKKCKAELFTDQFSKSAVEETVSSKADSNALYYTSDLHAEPEPSLTKVMKNGERQTVSLKPGPNNFLVATFSDTEVYETEFPNIMIVKLERKVEKPKSVMKVMKKAMKAMKRPASACHPPPPAHAAVLGGGAGAPKHGIMWYKKTKTIGIREKFGLKRQVVSFGGVSCEKSEGDMRILAKQVVEWLDNGMGKVEAKIEAAKLVKAA